MEAKQKHLITSALPYVNGVKHLGNLVGSMLPADVYARFRRQQGHDTLFICGSDDHGTPAELGAIKEKKNPADYVKYWHDFQADIYARFGLSFDWFGGTSQPQNHAITQHLARELHKQGLLDVRTEKMLFSKADDRFLPDRYVEGQCPKCGYAKARGDQCDGCGSVLDPTDLINPYSSISGSHDLELRESKHLYLKQSQLTDKLRNWIDQQTHWPKLSRSIAYKWLDEGLQDRGITRDMKWGVPVPTDTFGPDFANKVFYVWFDAPIGYIAATEEWANHVKGEKPTGSLPLSPSTQKWWYGAGKDVTYTEFMGKDNVYFHTLSFPATLIGSAEPWTLVSTLKSYSWLTYYGGKFSTSLGVGVFTDTAINLLPADYWRYYLLARAPEGDDSEFKWTDMQQVVNKDLADVLGNFINRTISLAHKQPTWPNEREITIAEKVLVKAVQDKIIELTEHLEKVELRKATNALRELWTLGNEYLAQQEPWKTLKTDPKRGLTVLGVALNLIPLFARASVPFIPFTAKKILVACKRVNDDLDVSSPDKIAKWPLQPRDNYIEDALFNTGQQYIENIPLLFTKITDEQVAEWEAKFGNQKA